MEKEVFRIEKPKLLVVEGKDEESFFLALIDHLQLDDIQVRGVGGKGKIRASLKALVIEPGFSEMRALGVVRDADSDPRGAFESVRDALAGADLPRPKRPLHAVKGPPKVNVMILPSWDKVGALEDLCLEAVGNTPAMVCVEQFFGCIQETERPKAPALAKAKTRVFLSSREDPTLPLGLAAQRGYWPFDHPAFTSLRGFVKSL